MSAAATGLAAVGEVAAMGGARACGRSGVAVEMPERGLDPKRACFSSWVGRAPILLERGGSGVHYWA